MTVRRAPAGSGESSRARLACLVAAALLASSARADTVVKAIAESRTESFAHAGAQVTTTRTSDAVDVGARIEGDAFIDAGDAGDAGDAEERPTSARLERLWASLQSGPFTLTLGDVHTQLGRGLALSLRPEAGVGLDTAVRGAHAKIALLDDVEVTALAGLANPANLDPLTLMPLTDPNDAIAGVEAALRGRGLTVGLLSSAVLPRERILADEQDATVTAGAFFDVTVLDGALGFALEADAQQKRLAGSLSPGAAVSSSARADMGTLDLPVSVVVDALWLAGFEVKGSRNDALAIRFDYGRPPSLERTDVQSVPSGDHMGARVTALLPWGLEASAMTSVDKPGSPAARTVVDGDVVGRLDLGALHGALGIGARDESAQALGKGIANRKMVRVDGEAALAVGHGFALTSTTRAQLWNDHIIGTAVIGAQRSGAGSLAIEAGLDTEHKDVAAGDRVWFLAAIASLEVAQTSVTPATTLRALGGSQRGGFRCAGGVCREVPAFTGLKLEMESRF